MHKETCTRIQEGKKKVKKLLGRGVDWSRDECVNARGVMLLFHDGPADAHWPAFQSHHLEECVHRFAHRAKPSVVVLSKEICCDECKDVEDDQQEQENPSHVGKRREQCLHQESELRAHLQDTKQSKNSQHSKDCKLVAQNGLWEDCY